MRQLYVPTIGEEFRLAEDWTFNLHAERRNHDLPQKLGLNFIRDGRRYDKDFVEKVDPRFKDKFVMDFWITPELKEDVENCFEDWNIQWKKAWQEIDDLRSSNISLFKKMSNGITKEDEIHQKYNIKELRKKCQAKTEELILERKDEFHIILPVTIPANSLLKLDRIYIRKGNSEYDSLSFYLKDIAGEKPKILGKSGRFWAKLEDCNNIKFI